MDKISYFFQSVLFYSHRKIKKQDVVTTLFVIGFFFLLFVSCTQKQEDRHISLISTPLLEDHYNFLLIKDDYARAFANRDSTKQVIKIFRQGDILTLLEQDVHTKKEIHSRIFVWYKVQHEDAELWLYAQNVILCQFLPEALLFRNRLY